MMVEVVLMMVAVVRVVVEGVIETGKLNTFSHSKKKDHCEQK